MRLPSFYRPLCVYCKHFALDSNEKKCTAFTNEIPHEIWLLGFDHREPHPDDGGVQFELIEDFHPLWKSAVFEQQSPTDNVADFEKREQQLLEDSLHEIELRRKFGTSEPRIVEDLDNYNPKSQSELDKIIRYMVRREIHDTEQELLEEKGEYLTSSQRIAIEIKADIKAMRNFITPQEEVRYIATLYTDIKNKRELIEMSILAVEAYRQIDEEQRLIEIFKEIDKIDYLKQAYEKLNLKFPSE